MDEQMQTKKGMSGAMITLLILLAAVVFGGGAYAYVNNKATKEKNGLNAQITDLQSQVASLQTTASATTSTSATTSATAELTKYINSKYNFSFKYPNGWLENSINTPSLDGVKLTSASEKYKNVSIEVFEITDNAGGPEGYNIISEKTPSYNGLSWKITNLKGIGSYEKDRYTEAEYKDSNHIVSVRAYYNIDINEADVDAVLTQILSTFQLTK